MKKIIHPIKPIYNNNSKILILGSFPSEKSREKGFYYAHPQNRFWRVLENIFNEEIISRETFLSKYNIALWDVIKSCKIKGSSDTSITDVEVNDINELINNSNIKHIFTTGSKAYNLYNKYLFKKTNIKAISLPSTSPANAVKNLNDLTNEYKIIKDYLKIPD